MNNLLILFICLIALPSFAYPKNCGGLENHFGPFDYRNPVNKREELQVVENAHFTNVTYNLAVIGADNKKYYKLFVNPSNRNKKKYSSIPADINYTLRVFPNHHRALYAMSEYQRIIGLDDTKLKHNNKFLSAECYFRRALEFVPDDKKVYMLYGVHYHKRKNYKKALEKYKEALALGKNSAELNYNIGLAYYHLDDIVKAREYAEIAYKMGFPLQGLKKLLKQNSNND